MIVRIVKMTFRSEKINEFLQLFEEKKELIRGFEGCNHLTLLQDVNSPNILFTYSYWNSENDLTKYKNSELFGVTWRATKQLFSAKAEAWSVHQKVVLN